MDEGFIKSWPQGHWKILKEGVVMSIWLAYSGCWSSWWPNTGCSCSSVSDARPQAFHPGLPWVSLMEGVLMLSYWCLLNPRLSPDASILPLMAFYPLMWCRRIVSASPWCFWCPPGFRIWWKGLRDVSWLAYPFEELLGSSSLDDLTWSLFGWACSLVLPGYVWLYEASLALS